MNSHKKVRGLILDMDGVLWRGPEPLGDLPEIFKDIDRNGIKVTLATNNATRSVLQYIDKLAGFGVSLEPWQVINSGLATAASLQKRFPGGGPLYIIGGSGLVDTLKEAGFYFSEEQPLAVIVSMDLEFSYQKLAAAQAKILAGALFVATNPDLTFPSPQGLTPGAGSILAAVQAASGREPVLIGKPQPEMFRLALEKLAILPGEALVVGDRLETDIAGGQAAGCQTALVLSGVTTEPEASVWSPPPNYIEPDLTSLLQRILNGRA